VPDQDVDGDAVGGNRGEAGLGAACRGLYHPMRKVDGRQSLDQPLADSAADLVA
jgi:hypothetical protein